MRINKYLIKKSNGNNLLTMNIIIIDMLLGNILNF
jgi:hypothetical protein